MWPLLKTELDYTKEGLVFTYAIAVIFFIVAAALKSWDLFGYVMNTSITYFIAMAIIGSEEDKEGRTRHLAGLPVTPQQLAMLDVLYVALFQLGMVLLWLCLLIFKPEDAKPTTLWGMLSQNGLVLGVITMFMIHHHLSFFGEKKYHLVSYGLLLALALLVAGLILSGHLKAVARFLWNSYFSATGALASTFLWLSLSYLNIMIFVRRKSYLE